MKKDRLNHKIDLVKEFFIVAKDESIKSAIGKALIIIGQKLENKKRNNKKLNNINKQGKTKQKKVSNLPAPSSVKDNKNAVLKSENSKNSTEIVFGNLSLHYKKIAIFASLDSKGIINDAVISYLQALRTVVDGIVFVTDNAVLPAEIAKIEKLVIYAQCGKHNEHSFGSYKRGVKWLNKTGLINEIDELVFCNDSCYAPVYPFKPMFEEMDQRQCDFWGICANDKFNYHVQSYFWVFKKRAFQSNVFEKFIDSIKHQNKVTDVIKNYEVALADQLMRTGLIVDSYMPNYTNSGVYPYYLHDLTHWPIWLIKQGCPLIKKKALLDENYNLDSIYNTVQYLKEHHSDLLKKVDYLNIKNPNEEYDFKFSIIMPTYNRRNMIDPVIERVLKQSYQKFELIIIDDGSEDGTFDYLKNRYCREIESGKIKLFNTNHDGVCKARNIGLKEANNDWIAYVDSDNIVIGDFLRTFCMAISENPDIRLFYGKTRRVRSDRVIGRTFDYSKLVKKNFIDLGTFVHHKSVYNENGGFDENMTRLVDWDLIARYTERNKVFFIDKIVLLYNDSNDYSRISNVNNYQENYAYFMKKRNLPHSVITVLITRNNEDFVRQSLDSILRQKGDFKHKILVVDNGSSDKTLDIINEYISIYRDLIEIAAKNIEDVNFCSILKESTLQDYKYINFIFGSDYWSGYDKIQKQVDFFCIHNECLMVTTLPVFQSKETGELNNYSDGYIEIMDKNYFIDNKDLTGKLSLSSCMISSDNIECLQYIDYKDEEKMIQGFSRQGKIGLINSMLAISRR